LQSVDAKKESDENGGEQSRQHHKRSARAACCELRQKKLDNQPAKGKSRTKRQRGDKDKRDDFKRSG